MADVPGFWEEQLVPMYKEWQASPEKDHLAKALAQFANNMAERLAHFHGMKPYDYRLQLRKDCPQFGLIWDLADGAKHVALGRPNAEVSHINQAVMSKLMDDWGTVDEIKNWDDHQVLVITDNANNRHKFEELINAVMAHYSGLLTKLGYYPA
jgi:hypothetical protein